MTQLTGRPPTAASGDYALYAAPTGEFTLLNVTSGQGVVLRGSVAPQSADARVHLYVHGDKVLVLVAADDSSAAGSTAYAGVWDTSGNPRSVTVPFSEIYGPVMSSDGAQVAYIARVDGNYGIARLDLRAPEFESVMGMGGRNYLPMPTGSPMQPLAFVGDALLLRDTLGTLALWLSDGTQSVVPFAGHRGGQINDLAYAPDGRTLVSAGSDGTVRLWDAATGAPLAVWDDLPAAVTRLAVSDTAAIMIDASSGVSVRALTGETLAGVGGPGRLYDLDIAGNVVALGIENAVQLFDLTQNWMGTPYRTLNLPEDLPPSSQVTAVAIGARYVAAVVPVGEGASMYLWDVATGAFVARLDLPPSVPGIPFDADFNADGTLLAVSNGVTMVWNLAVTFDEPAFVTASGGSGGAAFGAGDLLADAYLSYPTYGVRVYDTRSGVFAAEFRREVNTSGGGGGSTTYLPVAFSPDGRQLALGDAGGVLAVWDVPADLLAQAKAQRDATAFVVPYCASLPIAPVAARADQPVTLIWSWYAAQIAQVLDHRYAARYELTLDGVPLTARLGTWRVSTIRRDDANAGNWTVYYTLDVGALPPGEHVVGYRLTWNAPISDGFSDFGPGTANPDNTGTCTFTVAP